MSTSLLVVTGTNLGTGLGPNISNFFASSNSQFVGGNGAPGTVNTNVLQGAIGDTTVSGHGSGWLRSDPAMGLVLLRSNEYASSPIGTTSNLRISGSIASVGTSLNSLIVENGAQGSGGTVAIASGNVASLGNSANTISASMNFGSAGGHLFVNTDLTVSGAMLSTGGVSKTGPGTLTLNTANSFTGGFNVFGGTLRISNSNQLPGSSVRLDNGATIQVTSAVTSSGSIGVANGGGIFDTNGQTVNWTGQIGTLPASSFGMFTKTGAGTFNHNNTGENTNFNFGGLRVLQGTFNSLAGNIADNAPVSVASGATFTLSVAESVGSIDGQGTIQFTNTLSVGSDSARLANTTFAGNLTGSGSIIKQGSGTLTLLPGATASNYSGSTDIQRGFVVLGESIGTGVNGILGNSSTPILMNVSTGGNFAGLLTQSNFSIDRDITIRSGANATTILGTEALSGTTTFATGRSITIGTSVSSVPQTLLTTMPAGAVVDLQSQVVMGGGYTGPFTLDQVGPGILILSSATSNYTGETVLSEGTLVINASSNAASPPSSGPLGQSTLVINSGTLAADAGTRTVGNPLRINGDFTLGSASY